MKKPKLIILDPGHGGIHPETGEYTTAPNKMAYHEGYYMHRDGWFYEGVWNRDFCIRLAELAAGAGLPVCFTIEPSRWHEDVRLSERVTYVNVMSQIHDVLLISIHANAHDGSVRGWQVHTSPGKTQSDIYASYLHSQVETRLGNKISLRSDNSDGDVDFENKFQVLTRTRCPAILCENLFFDNKEDAKLLLQESFLTKLSVCYMYLFLVFYKLDAQHSVTWRFNQ
jgi:N-acetylmuramoyl-L-alanine amidase